MAATVVLFPTCRPIHKIICRDLDRSSSDCHGSGVKPSLSRQNRSGRNPCNTATLRSVGSFDSMLDFTIWNEVEPPRGTVYHYPIRPSHHARPHVAGTPAAPDIAMQIYSRGTQPLMLAKLFTGQSIPQTIAWAEEELAGFAR